MMNADELRALLSNFQGLIEKTGDLYNAEGQLAVPASKAAIELETYAMRNQIESAHSIGTICLESTSDHLYSFLDAIREPAQTIGPWTCVRGAMEVSAITTWLFDLRVDAQERVGRQFSYRYEGLSQQISYAKSRGDVSAIANAAGRVEVLENKAVSLGFPKVLDRKNKPIGIGQIWPGPTNLIRDWLGLEEEYRLFSAMAHGHGWAMQQLGFKKIEEGPQLVNHLILQKHVHPESVMFLVVTSLRLFAAALWATWKMFGWNLDALSDLLDECCDKMHYTGERLWK